MRKCLPFNEIILNALEASKNEANKITVRINEQQQLSPLLNYNWLKIEIFDSGRSIIEDFLPYIREPFFTTQKHEGHTGFGLNIAEKIFKEHGGSLDINATEEEGTTVTIFLPVEHEKAKNISN